jgi:hypothetical protein
VRPINPLLALFLKKLRNSELLNRDYIVQLGRQSIRCGLSGKLYDDPILGPDGISYENNLIQEYIHSYCRMPNGTKLNLQENNNEIVLYKNRTLKDLIEKLKTINL